MPSSHWGSAACEVLNTRHGSLARRDDTADMGRLGLGLRGTPPILRWRGRWRCDHTQGRHGVGEALQTQEVMRSLRWAAQLAVEGDEAKAELGVAHLRALGKSDILDSDGQRFIDAALAAVVSEPVRARQAGANLVVGVSTTASGTVSGVASGQDQSDEKGGFGGN
jgi:hypothetical protein